MNALMKKNTCYKEFNSFLQVPESVYKSLVPELVRINQDYGSVNYFFFFLGKPDVWDKEPFPEFSQKTEP